jgi:hypothetical protein
MQLADQNIISACFFSQLCSNIAMIKKIANAPIGFMLTA